MAVFDMSKEAEAEIFPGRDPERVDNNKQGVGSKTQGSRKDGETENRAGPGWKMVENTILFQ